MPIEQQRLKATTASHALLAAGHSVHLDPTLNMLTTPDGDREAALHYLTQLAERASAAKTSTAVAEVLTEIAAPVHGLLPLTREVILRAWIAASDLQSTASGEEPEPIAQLGSTATSLNEAARVIRHARNHAAHPPQPPTTAPAPGRAQPPASRRR
ncbi:hypothetical protein [Streptomyces misionensis]|uniref:hypothetical protein n=1 Tax=Streptomyces misionensis TaxID=67331 RepID=UPI003676F4D9